LNISLKEKTLEAGRKRLEYEQANLISKAIDKKSRGYVKRIKFLGNLRKYGTSGSVNGRDKQV